MDNMYYFYFKIYCEQCRFDKIDHEAIYHIPCNIKNNSCNHFDIIIMKTFDKKFRTRIVLVCKICSKVKNIDTNLGKTMPNGNTILNESGKFNCCNNNIQIYVYLTHDERNNLPNNINNMMRVNNVSNFNSNMIVLNEEENNNNIELKDILRREKEELEKKNIIDFNLKNKILYFLDDKSKKSYKIYIRDDMKLKYVLDDLENQFPDLNAKNRILKIGNHELNPESQINSYSINESNIIVMQ